MTDHYANVFTTAPGQCFRLVHNPAALGQPMQCPDPPTFRGVFVDAKGKRHRVESCAGHVGELEEFESEGQTFVREP